VDARNVRRTLVWHFPVAAAIIFATVMSWLVSSPSLRCDRASAIVTGARVKVSVWLPVRVAGFVSVTCEAESIDST
jgi:hypothetical protein